MNDYSSFNRIQNHINSKYNSNAHFDKMPWPVRLWILEICREIDNQIAYIKNTSDKMKKNT